MADTLVFEIVTPEGTIRSEDVEMVTLPAIEGQIGVLPRHVGLFTRLVPGEITVRTAAEERFLVVGEGLVEIGGDRVTIVTDMAIAVERIDTARVEEARRQAEARLREKISKEEIAAVNASLTRSLAQLRVKRRHRG
jgi:F-type H+-transporting ATPase subunit epsilon